jgi:acyl-CoA synthetase
MRVFDDELIRRYTAAGHWDAMTLAQRIGVLAEADPGGLAFATEDERMTWGAYDRESTRLAAKLAAAGLSPGDRLGVLLPDGPTVHAAYVAAEKAGLVLVGIAPRSRVNEIAHLVDTSGCRALLTTPEHRGAPSADTVAGLRERGHEIDVHLTLDAAFTLARDGEPVADADPERLAGRALGPDELWLVNSTSGTTGLPKCVIQTQNRWKFFHQVAADAGALTREDVFLSLIPAPFGFGLWTAHFTPTLLGAPCWLQPAFDVERAIALIETARVSVLCCVSTQFVMMLNSPALDRHDLSSLRVMFTGGERVPYNRSLEFEERTGGLVLQFYGSNESGAISRTTVRDTRERRLRTAGQVIDAMAARVVDLDSGEDLTGTGQPGLCLCRGPAATPGYYDDAEANTRLFTPAGEMRASDVVTIDAEGYLTVVGRDSDIVIRGGQNISAVAVEELIGAHPRVSLVGVAGVPDDVFGERVCAFVCTHDGGPIALAELTAFLDAEGVSKYLWPEHLVVVDELPRAPGGKIDKGELRRRLREDRVHALEASDA